MSTTTVVNFPVVQTVETFLQRDFPEKEPLIDGLLYRRDLITLGGRRRHGKTSLISTVGASLALGLPDFLGFKIAQATRVMMFYLEDDGGEIQRNFGKSSTPHPFRELETIFRLFRSARDMKALKEDSPCIPATTFARRRFPSIRRKRSFWNLSIANLKRIDRI